MKLWKIWQTQVKGYDVYDSAVVAAETEEEARGTHPYGNFSNGGWADSPEHVAAEFIGTAAPGVEAGVIVASFNAG